MVVNTNVHCAQNRIIIHLMFPFRFNFIHYYFVSQKKPQRAQKCIECWKGNICASHSLLTFLDLFLENANCSYSFLNSSLQRKPEFMHHRSRRAIQFNLVFLFLFCFGRSIFIGLQSLIRRMWTCVWGGIVSCNNFKNVFEPYVRSCAQLTACRMDHWSKYLFSSNCIVRRTGTHS